MSVNTGGVSFTQWLNERIGGQEHDEENTNVTLDTAIQVPVVRYALNKVTSAIAQVPFQIYENTDDGKVPAKKHKWYYTTKEEPNRWSHKFDFMEFLLAEAIMYGDGRAVIDDYYLALDLFPGHKALYVFHDFTYAARFIVGRYNNAYR